MTANHSNDPINNDASQPNLTTATMASNAPQNDGLQAQLVKDSITHNQNTMAQVQSNVMQEQNTDNAQFTQAADLPQGTPQGQQATQPYVPPAQNNTNQNSNPQASQHSHYPPRFNPRDDINNPHTLETDGLEETHFGYKKVKKAEKQARVADVFTSVAKKYDIMNDLMSFGIHRLWKRYAISLSGVRAGQHVLDIAGGTGDLAKVFSREVGRSGHVVLSDINEAMLEVGRERLLNAGCNNVDFVLANAETLAPFDDNSFDLLTISFGLRNVTDKDAALRSMYRVLKPGGRLLILEFSKPIFEPLSKAYDIYSFTALPVMGKLVAGDSESYQYLAESIRMHPNQQTLKQMMETAGFENCDYHNLTAGIVAVHRGFKK